MDRKRNMRSSDWEILRELHRTPNLTKIAAMLFTTQPNITKRLQHMEKEFGVTIVERTPGGLVFTEAGEYLAGQAEKYLHLDQETRKGLQEVIAQGRQKLVIGSAFTFSNYSWDPLMEPFLEMYPSLECVIVNRLSDTLYMNVLDGELDAAFVRGDYRDGLDSVKVENTQAYLVTRDPVDPECLPEMTWIRYQTNKKTSMTVDAWWRERFGDTEPKYGKTDGYVDFALQSVGKGKGFTICFLPAGFRNPEDLRILPLTWADGSPVMRGTWFIYRKEKRRGAMLDTLIRYVKAHEIV